MLQRSHSVITSLLVALAVGACAESPYRASNLQEVKGDGMSVVITHARSEAEARPLAERLLPYARRQLPAFQGHDAVPDPAGFLKVAAFECLPEATPQAQAATDFR